MNFQLTRANREDADFNMTIDLLATVMAIKDVMAELLAQKDGIESQKAKDNVSRRIDTYRQVILDKLDEDYGTVDLEELKTNPHGK